MTTPEAFLPFLEPLAALQRLLDKYENRGVVIGGIASSLLGKPRLTADIDAMFLLSVSAVPAFLKAAEAEGFHARIADAVDFAAKNRVILLTHSTSGTNLDISMGVLPFEEEVVARSNLVEVSNMKLRLPTPEDLIIMKAVAHRPQDMLDVQALLESHPNIDRIRIEKWVTEFSSALEAPEIWEDLAELLGR